jgi:hypothetical protein
VYIYCVSSEGPTQTITTQEHVVAIITSTRASATATATATATVTTTVTAVPLSFRWQNITGNSSSTGSHNDVVIDDSRHNSITITVVVTVTMSNTKSLGTRQSSHSININIQIIHRPALRLVDACKGIAAKTPRRFLWSHRGGRSHLELQGGGGSSLIQLVRVEAHDAVPNGAVERRHGQCRPCLQKWSRRRCGFHRALGTGAPNIDHQDRAAHYV